MKLFMKQGKALSGKAAQEVGLNEKDEEWPHPGAEGFLAYSQTYHCRD